ncbi:MAG TPA: hypothetical protein VF659_02410 [Pyrinomonadaceae bacterium]|jgi:hypothetical protein
MPRRLRNIVPALFILCAAAAAPAQGTRTPAPGSAERRAVTDALRAPVEKELRQKVVFKIDHLKAAGGWAFLRGVPQRPGGGKVDYDITPYRERADDGAFDDWICALLRKKGGKWQVVKYNIGATDVVYLDWDKEFKAPPEIFR